MTQNNQNPPRYFIVGRPVLENVRDNAPEPVRRIVAELVDILGRGPYPGSPLLHATSARGFPSDHYIAAYDNVMLLYAVRETAPVRLVLLVDVFWT